MNLQRLHRLMLLIFTLRPLEWSRKSGECTVLVPMPLNFIHILSRAHPLLLPITILYLMSGCGRSYRKFKKICTKKNEEIQQKNEEMQKQIEEMKKREELRLKREDEMQQKIL